MEIVYRKAELKDIEHLVNLRMNLCYYDCKEENQIIQNELQLRENIRSVLKKELNKTIYFYIALEKERVIAGSAIVIQQLIPFFNIPDGKAGFISSVFTEENYRRRGIQKELIRLILEFGKKQNCTRIELNASNPNAVKLYEAYGFKRMKTKFRLEF